MDAELKTACLHGLELKPFLPEVAQLRINIFKEYPYLYEGNLDYEMGYLKTYSDCAESFMVLVLAENKVVGASTAIPMEYETIDFQQPFLDHNIPLKTIFYLGESLLLPAFRGRGIYRHFFEKREQAAQKYGANICTFAAVVRDLNDPRRPKNYVDLEETWQHFAYQKTNFCTAFEWQEIGNTAPTKQRMHFWMKNI
jgi:GNAT superfamily N-acetyltransferase